MSEPPLPDTLKARADEKVRRVAALRGLGAELQTPEAILALVHDLHVHQIELEMQNDELRRSQQELAASEARFFDLYHRAPVGYCTVSEDWTILEANLTGAELVGVPAATLVGQPIARVVAFDDQDIFYRFRRELTAEAALGVAHVCVLRVARPDGVTRWVRLDVVGARAHETAPRTFRIAMSDADPLERSKANVRAAAERFRRLADSTTDLVFTLDRERRIDGAFGRSATSSGLADAQGQTRGELCAPGLAALHDQAERRALSGEDVVYQHPDVQPDSGRTFQTSLSPLRGEDGGIVGVVGISRDISAQLALAEKLRLASSLASLGTLAAGVAHEINTPLQFLGMSVEFLKESADRLTEILTARREELAGVLSEVEEILKDLPETVDAARVGVRRIAGIVRGMRAYTEPSHVAMEPADLNQSVQRALTQLRDELVSVAEVECDMGELPLVCCHIAELDRALAHLVSNAAHAVADAVQTSGGKGRVTVRTRADGDDAVITVSDSGVGIPDELRERVFEPFFTTKDVGKGTGLGLGAARTIIVDRHGGSLTFESGVGRGTTFLVRLPIRGMPRVDPNPSGNDDEAGSRR
ncbi:MAG: ATP-binding protein [Myxococcota bacterium]